VEADTSSHIAENDTMTAGNDPKATGNNPAVASVREIAVVNDRGCYRTPSGWRRTLLKTLLNVPLKIKQKKWNSVLTQGSIPLEFQQNPSKKVVKVLNGLSTRFTAFYCTVHV
jgi:hypothetical protein